ncbi:hypothetical protein J6590_056383 [Homalodisca vitripennis]|nr:hypothetical protein J6590_056383 [Homalodisca vitripennis]
MSLNNKGMLRLIHGNLLRHTTHYDLTICSRTLAYEVGSRDLITRVSYQTKLEQGCECVSAKEVTYSGQTQDQTGMNSYFTGKDYRSFQAIRRT